MQVVLKFHDFAFDGLTNVAFSLYNTICSSSVFLPPHFRLKNVDRSTANSMAVTVNGITVIITDFKPKAKLEPDANTQTEKKIKAES